MLTLEWISELKQISKYINVYIHYQYVDIKVDYYNVGKRVDQKFTKLNTVHLIHAEDLY